MSGYFVYGLTYSQTQIQFVIFLFDFETFIHVTVWPDSNLATKTNVTDPHFKSPRV